MQRGAETAPGSEVDVGVCKTGSERWSVYMPQNFRELITQSPLLDSCLSTLWDRSREKHRLVGEPNEVMSR